MKLLVTLLIGFQVLVPVLSRAADWHEVQGKGADGAAKVFVDHDSLVVDHDYVVRGWVRFDYATPRERDGNILTGVRAQHIVNCEEHRYWIAESWGVLKNGGDPVRLYNVSQEWQLPIPDSESEAAVWALCYESKSLFGILWDKIKDGFNTLTGQ